MNTHAARDLPNLLPRGAVAGYVYAAVAVGVATLVAVALGLRLDPVVVAPFLAAVGVSAALAGFGPALFATVLSAVICYWHFLSPLLLLDLDHGTLWRLTVYRLGLFVAAALVLTAAAGLRRRSEEELRRSHRQLLRFLTDSNVGLCEISADGRITWADAGACDLLGHGLDDVAGRPLVDIVPDGGVAAALLACTREESAVENQRTRVRCADGTQREVLVNASGSWTYADGPQHRTMFAMLPVPTAPDREIPLAAVTPITAPRRTAAPPPQSASA